MPGPGPPGISALSRPDRGRAAHGASGRGHRRRLRGHRRAIEEEHAEIEALLERAARGPDAARTAHLLHRAVALARGHFSREEHLEFVRAEARLDHTELRRLGRRWAARRRVYAPRTEAEPPDDPGVD